MNEVMVSTNRRDVCQGYLRFSSRKKRNEFLVPFFLLWTNREMVMI